MNTSTVYAEANVAKARLALHLETLRCRVAGMSAGHAELRQR